MVLIYHVSVIMIFSPFFTSKGWQVLESTLQKQRSSKAFSWCPPTEGEPDFRPSSISGTGERRPSPGGCRYAKRAGPLSQHHQQIREPPRRLMKRRKEEQKEEKDTINDFEIAIQGLFNSSWNSIFSLCLLQISTTILCSLIYISFRTRRDRLN